MVSRETRLLLITVVVSIAALWVLARVRFQDRPMSSAPVAPVLAQLRPSLGYADLARVVAEIRPGVNAALFASGGLVALRLRETTAVALTASSADHHVARDRATGLSVLRSPVAELPGLMPWAPRLLDYPRYLVAAEAAGEHVSLRPVFVSGLFPTSSPLWPGDIWMLPPSTAIAPGTFVFTTDGALAGLGIEHRGGPALVPATLLLNAAERLVEEATREPGEIGIAVQSVSPEIARATGARAGVVVTAVAPDGPAAGKLAATDIIEAVDGQEIVTPDVWRARIGRIRAGETVSLSVRRNGAVQEMQVSAVPLLEQAAEKSRQQAALGLTMRVIPGIGSQVLSVNHGSRAARAGLHAEDVITVAGPYAAPTPRQVIQAFDALRDGSVLLVAVSRDNEHRVIVLEK